MKTSSASYRYSVSDQGEGSDSSVRQPGGLKVWYVFLAVHQVSRGISVKWMLTNVALRPATMVPFAKILLIATSATAGQVSHSDILRMFQFTLKWVNQRASVSFRSLVTGNLCGLWKRLPRCSLGGCFTAPQMWWECSLPYVNHVNTYSMPLLDWKGPLKVTIMYVLPLKHRHYAHASKPCKSHSVFSWEKFVVIQC